MNMVLFEGLDLLVLFNDQNLQIAAALAKPCITGQLGLERGLGRLQLS